MDVRIRELGSYPVVDIEGEVTLYDVGEIVFATDKLIKEGHLKVVFNLEHVPFLDSSGVGQIVRTMSELSKRGGALKISNLQKPIENLVSRALKNQPDFIYPTTEEAVASF